MFHLQLCLARHLVHSRQDQGISNCIRASSVSFTKAEDSSFRLFMPLNGGTVGANNTNTGQLLVNFNRMRSIWLRGVSQ